MNLLIQRKNCIASALSLVIGSMGVASVAADTIFSWDLQDYDNDGLKSDFAFYSPPSGDSANTFGPAGETGCTAAADLNTCDPIFFDSGEIAVNVFSTGFNFGGTGQFAPNVTDGVGGGTTSGQIFVADSDGNLGISFTELDFGGVFGGVQFLLAPDDINAVAEDPGFPLASNGDGTVNAVIRWVGTIDEPTSPFDGFASNWRLEGTIAVADAAPFIFINNGGFGASGDVTTQVIPDTTYVDQGAVCQDVVDGQITGAAFTTTINNPNDPSTGPAGSSFPVVYECTDSQSNVSQATRTVVAGADTDPPVITLGVGASEPGRNDSADGSIVDILVGVPYLDAGATCVDNLDGNIPLGSIAPPFFVTPNPPLVDTSTASTGNIIQFSCDDNAGNGPTVADRTVNVLADDQPPVITLNGANPLTVALGGVYDDPGAVCTDTNPVDPDPVDISANLDISPTSIDTSQQGTTLVTYNCNDAAGNPAVEQTRTVNVVSGENFRIISMTISDLDGDGIAGCFKFDSLDTATCSLANRFSSDGSAVSGFDEPANATFSGTGTDLDDDGNPIGIRFGVFQPITEFKVPPEFGTQPQPVGPISPGFMFSGFPFVPLTVDPPTTSAEPPSGFVTVSGNTGIITIESMPFSGLYNSSNPNLFFLNPDPGTLSSVVFQINNDDDGVTRTFDYSMTWSHIITPEEDPTGAFVNFNAFWRLEGVIKADSVPFVVNEPPQVTDMRASQSDRDPTTIVVTNDGTVTVSVTASDPDGDGLLYDWSQNTVTAVGPTDQSAFEFDPFGLSDDPIAIKVIVSDDAEEPLSVETEIVLNVEISSPSLSSSEDSNGNGIDDATEGFGDDDNDGIPNYQDAIDGNTDPGRNRVDFSDPSRGDIVVGAGRLRLGQVTTAAGNGIFVTTEDEIAQYGGPGLTPVDNALDRLNLVDKVGPIEGGIRDFTVDGLGIGEAVQVVLPQDQPLPELPVYRKYTATKGWVPFSAVSGAALASAKKVNGVCPGPSDAAYDSPVDPNGNTFMVQGDECVRLTIVDGGVNDGDFTRNGVVDDPGTPSDNGTAASRDRIGNGSGGFGCTLFSASTANQSRGDLWLFALFLAGLYGIGRYRHLNRR